MKLFTQTLSVLALFVLSTLGVYAQTPHQGVFIEVTSEEDITAGNYLIVTPKTIKKGKNNVEVSPRALSTFKEYTKKNVKRSPGAPCTISSDGLIVNPEEALVWRVEARDNGKFSIYNAVQNVYLHTVAKTNNAFHPATELTPEDGYFSIGQLHGKMALYVNYKKDPKYLAYNPTTTPDETFVGSNNTSAAYAPRLFKQAIQFVISPTGYSSFFFNQSYKLSEGVKAYTATPNAAHTQVELTPISGNIVPANTGVILQGTPNTTYNLLTTNAAGTAVAGNALQGSMTGIAAADIMGDTANDYYVLTNKGTTALFGLLQSALPQYRAYFKFPKAAGHSAPFLNIALPTAVNAAPASAAQSDAPVYDLNGRRVSKLVPGNIYVRNGRKFIPLR